MRGVIGMTDGKAKAAPIDETFRMVPKDAAICLRRDKRGARAITTWTERETAPVYS